MKKIGSIFITLHCLSIIGFAQLTREQRLRDSVIGWDPPNRYDELKPSGSVIDRKKEAYLNKMAEWVKRSYTPVAGLGGYQRFINATNYQVTFSVWDVDFNYLDAQKHFRPVGETGSPRFYIAANLLAGAWNIDFMCKPDTWYFTMQPDGYSPNETERKHRIGSDPRICPLAHPYLTWVNEWYAVYLAPGNKLPMTRVTRGEFLQRALNSLDAADQRRIDVQSLLEKYKSSLDSPASVRAWQFNAVDITAGDWDVFHGGPNTLYYPVYRIDAATIAKMKEAQPLWISVIFPFEKPTDGNKSYEMYAAMTQHLNYDYIYNYFFDTAKVRGRGYTPVDEDGLKARLDGFRKKNAANIEAHAGTRSWAPDSHFEDDFGSTQEGNEPVNWFFSRHDELDKVVTLKEYPGKWLHLGYGNPSMPVLLKKPFPKSFSVEFDVITSSFTGRYGGGVRLYLSTNRATPNGNEQNSAHSATLGVDITAGNENDYNKNNYAGTAMLQLLRLPEVNEEHFSKGAKSSYALREFTDKKRMIHVGLEVNNGNIRLLINGKEVIGSKNMRLAYGGKCADCTMPTDLDVNYIVWKGNQSGIPSYIGNVKIIKK